MDDSVVRLIGDSNIPKQCILIWDETEQEHPEYLAAYTAAQRSWSLFTLDA